MKFLSPDEDTKEPDLKQPASNVETVQAATTLPDLVEIKSTSDLNHSTGDVFTLSIALLGDERTLHVLQKLGLEKRVNRPIEVSEALAVTLEDNGKVALDPTTCSWTLLRNIVLVNSNALNECIPSTRCAPQATKKKLNQLKLKTKQERFSDGLSPLDMFLAMYTCCDPMLRQLLVRKMYLCKLSIPFIFNSVDGSNVIVDSWPLRSLKLFHEAGMAESGNVLTMKAKTVTFARIGRPNFSKSQCLNAMVSGQTNVKQVFFDRECNGGNITRVLSEGITEIFWLPVQEENVFFSTPVSFLNIRGPIEYYKNKQFLQLIQSVSDCIVVVVESTFVSMNLSKCLNLLQNLSSVVLVLSGNIDEISTEACEALENYAFCCTHEANNPKTMRDFVVELKDEIKSLPEKEPLPLLSRLQSFKDITSTENTPEITASRSKAVHLVQCMKDEIMLPGNKYTKWKDCLTPCSHTLSKEISELESELAKPNDLAHIESKHKRLNHLRQKQCSNVSKSVLLFVNNLVECKTARMCLIQWLQSFIDSDIKSALPKHMKEKDIVLKKLKDTALTESSKEELKREIERLNNEIDNANFGTEFFFREIGHICDSAIELNTDTSVKGLPSVDEIATVIADLIISGISFELVDGDSGYMPKHWINTVFQKLSSKLGGPKIAVVSVLGVQSSGKSTFLNSMFGLDMAASAGRCTKGIHLRLLPIKETTKRDFPFSYLLIVDSEGLRAPELAGKRANQNHDNMLATFVTGLGDVTLINNMGENFSEMKDILEIVVHAFLRLKLAGNALSIGQTCLFLHQNVTEEHAGESMRDGFVKLLKLLDTVTQESAESEGIKDLKHFNDIIKFDILSSVFTIPNLWQGYPPMRTVSRCYTKKVHDIKESIFKALLNEGDKSFINLEDFSVRATDIWKGVLCENFVFSFRNNLEIKAYFSIELKLEKINWSLEIYFQEQLNTIIRECFSSCKDVTTLDEAERSVRDVMSKKLAAKQIELGKAVEQVFDDSEYKEIAVSWKGNRLRKLDIRVDEMKDLVSVEASKFKTKLSIKFKTEISKHDRDTIRQVSIAVAKGMQGKTVSQKEINDTFENDIWRPYCKQILSTHPERKLENLQKSFERYLAEEFRKDIHLLNREIQGKSMCHERPLQKLPGSCILLDIKDDINTTKLRSLYNMVSQSKPPDYNKMIEFLFQQASEIINKIISRGKEIQDIDIMHFVRELNRHFDVLKDTLKQCHCSVTAAFQIKIYLHICKFACTLFEDNNHQCNKEHGVQKQLDDFKRILKNEFELAVRGREGEEAFASQITNVLQIMLKEMILNDLPTDILKVLKPCMPQLKSEMIENICKDLGRNDIFEDYMAYVIDAKCHAKGWFGKEVDTVLFSEGKYAEKVKEQLDTKSDILVKAVTKCTNEFNGNTCTSGTWIQRLQQTLNQSLLSNSALNLLNQNVILNDTKHFLECLLEQNFKKTHLQDMLLSENCNSTTASNIRTIAEEKIFEIIWGCGEQCPFCYEPCAKQDHQSGNHLCKQHRPTCCRGVRWKHTGQAVITVCNFDIDSGCSYSCSVIGKKCGCTSKQYHPYKEYKTFNPNWDIVPSSNMYDTSKFWMRFVGRFKDKLANRYSYLVNDVPSDWSTISLDEARESLKKYS